METEKLATVVADLERKAGLLDDIISIINLQAKFNYCLELNNTDRIVNELFAQHDPHVRCEIADTGVYEGIESIRRFWKARHNIQSIRGYLGTIMLETPHVQISEDGTRARGIWHAFGPNSVPANQQKVKQATGERVKLTATWYMGKYQNEYVKEDGVWRIQSLHALKYMQSPYDQSWVEAPDVYRFSPPASECVPDKPGTGHSPYDPAAQNTILPSAHEPRGLVY
ncbi:nuclear transport factor 2 family protein [Burkholderia diffusa]|uniref:nuclear transport factor 2 family protein n=1 Tax=Burkholderia diffusa TaxID=488732 RepID=UPI002ABE2166|nr:nuclear transport factor 2 family protein [Burkholderia diffusa]